MFWVDRQNPQKSFIIWYMILYKLQDLILMSPAKRDRLITINLFLSLGVNILLWVLLFFNFWQNSRYIVLGYNIYFGISAFGLWYQVLIMPLIGLVVILLNFALSFAWYLSEKIISYALATVASIINIILFLAALIIIYVNI